MSARVGSSRSTFLVSLIVGASLTLVLSIFVIPTLFKSALSVFSYILLFFLFTFIVQVFSQRRQHRKEVEFVRLRLDELDRSRETAHVNTLHTEVADWLEDHLHLERPPEVHQLSAKSTSHLFKMTLYKGRIVFARNPMEYWSSWSGPLYPFVPSVLTALGILGTFWGISVGLTGLGQLSGLDSSSMIRVIQPLLKGMSTAFRTSLLGIGSAIVFILLERILAARCQATLTRLQQRLDRLCILGKPEASGLGDMDGEELALQIANALDALLTPLLLRPSGEYGHAHPSSPSLSMSLQGSQPLSHDDFGSYGYGDPSVFEMEQISASMDALPALPTNSTDEELTDLLSSLGDSAMSGKGGDHTMNVRQVQASKGELAGELVRQQSTLVQELEMFVTSLHQSQSFMKSMVEETEYLLKQHQTHLESSVRQTARLVEAARKALEQQNSGRKR
jgi:hypothetical protein